MNHNFNWQNEEKDCESPFSRMLKLLISHGANVNITDDKGCSVAHVVSKDSVYDSIIEELFKK